jgi:cytochrome c-type biogenesis protein CcmF
LVGVISLALTLLLSLGAVLCFAGGSEAWQRRGRILMGLSAAFAAVASIYLLILILNNRFDIAYVANYSAIELPLMYKISAFWAGQQGSFDLVLDTAVTPVAYTGPATIDITPMVKTLLGLE